MPASIEYQYRIRHKQSPAIEKIEIIDDENHSRMNITVIGNNLEIETFGREMVRISIPKICFTDLKYHLNNLLDGDI